MVRLPQTHFFKTNSSRPRHLSRDSRLDPVTEPLLPEPKSVCSFFRTPNQRIPKAQNSQCLKDIPFFVLWGNNPFTCVKCWGLTKAGFPKGWFWRMFPWNENRKRGDVHMFPGNENRNEGTFACSPGTKTGTRGTFARTTLLRNRPFVSQSLFAFLFFFFFFFSRFEWHFLALNLDYHSPQNFYKLISLAFFFVFFFVIFTGIRCGHRFSL